MTSTGLWPEYALAQRPSHQTSEIWDASLVLKIPWVSRMREDEMTD
jgi:hypothetical protein